MKVQEDYSLIQVKYARLAEQHENVEGDHDKKVKEYKDRIKELEKRIDNNGRDDLKHTTSNDYKELVKENERLNSEVESLQNQIRN